MKRIHIISACCLKRKSLLLVVSYVHDGCRKGSEVRYINFQIPSTFTIFPFLLFYSKFSENVVISMRIKIFWSILQKSNKRWRLPYNPLLKESYYVSINQTFCVFFSPKSYWWGQQSVFPCKKSPKLTQQVHLEAGLHRGGDVVVGGAAAEHTVHIMPAQWRSFSLLFQRTPNFLPIL